MFFLNRMRLGLFFTFLMAGTLAGALLAWLVTGGMQAGFPPPVWPLVAGAVWGGSCGLVWALNRMFIRPALSGIAPALSWMFEVLILAPAAFASALFVYNYTIKPGTWTSIPLEHGELWILGLSWLAGFSFLDAFSLLARNRARQGSLIPTGRLDRTQGFMLAVSACPPAGMENRVDAEKQLRLAQVTHQLFRRHGARWMGIPLHNSQSDLVMFIHGRSNQAKNTIFPLLSRCMHDLSVNQSRYRSEFGFVPRLSMAVHFGSLVLVRPGSGSPEGLGASVDLTVTCAAEKEARSRRCPLWVSDAALGKIVLPREFKVNGSTPLKEREGLGASRMYFITCPQAMQLENLNSPSPSRNSH